LASTRGKIFCSASCAGSSPRSSRARTRRRAALRSHHSARAPQFRGGGKAHGPVVRSHEHDLPKKVRILGLKHALSAKAKASSLIVVDDLKLTEAKTKALVANFEKLGLTNALMIGGADLDQNFKRAASNIPNIDVLPIQGINVYDILRRGTLVLSKAAVEALEERFK
jgi:large subunit ribosomal protein L4